MKNLFISLSVFCGLGFLFSINPWLGMVGIFMLLAYLYPSMKAKTQVIHENLANYFKAKRELSERERITNPASNQRSKISMSMGWVGYFVLIIIAKLMFQYVSSEIAVSYSKNSAWDEKYKQEFISNCSKGSVISIKEEYPNKSLTDEQYNSNIISYSNKYCECMQAKVESRHILSPKYNKLSRSIAQAEKEQSEIVAKYLATEDGKKEVETCSNFAVTALSK